LSKTGGIAGYFKEFANEVSVKDKLKLRCQNVKLFLREPLDREEVCCFQLRSLTVNKLRAMASLLQ